MPLYSRLLALFIITATGSLAVNSAAQAEETMPEVVDQTQVAQTGTHESISNGFPFNAQNTPSASVGASKTSVPVSKAPAAEHVTPVVESPKVVGNQCAKPAENQFQKSMLVTAFPRLVATTSTEGDLYLAEQQVPQLLSQQLITQHSAITSVQLMEGLPRLISATMHNWPCRFNVWREPTAAN